jgi:hypothetical protein
MLEPEEIDEQQQLLVTYRRTLAVYLQQQAEIGRAYSPPALINGINETRDNIRRIKSLLGTSGITVAEDPDDDEAPPPPRLRILSAQGGELPRWLVPAVVGTLVVVLAIGVGWWFARPLGNTSGQPEAPLGLAELPTAEEDASLGLAEPPTAEEETPTPQQAALGGQELPAVEEDVAALEQRLLVANIELSGDQVDEVRAFLNNPDTGYKLLAEHALEVLGDQKFRQTIYLDELDTKYTELVGEAHYADFDAEHLKEAMVAAWNNHYPDQLMDSFDQIVE